MPDNSSQINYTKVGDTRMYKRYYLHLLFNIILNMKLCILAILALVGVAVARPQGPGQYQQAYIVRYDSDNDGAGQYSYNVETSDGFVKQEAGQLQNPGSENEILSVTGSYSYVGPDGVTYTVTYTADENGFQPEGEHIPAAASVRKTPQLGIPSAALASLAGGGLG